MAETGAGAFIFFEAVIESYIMTELTPITATAAIATTFAFTAPATVPAALEIKDDMPPVATAEPPPARAILPNSAMTATGAACAEF